MARATRSSATQVQDKQPDPPRTKASSSKKRKRPDNDDNATQKQQRIKEENDDTPKLHNVPLAADVPIDPADAQQILDILEL